jgi:hypothetical protein
MTTFSSITIPKVDGLSLSIEGDARLMIRGMIATREPNQNIGIFFRALHGAILAEHMAAFTVDVSELTFVNSSAIRLFIDWAMWLNQLAAAQRYRLTFVTSRHVTWQVTNFSALRSLVGNVVFVEPKDGTAA